jgi:hypothetical protein
VAGVIVAFDGWNASGVGWGEQGWGEGVGNLTATVAVGDVTVFAQTTATVLVDGNAATAELGDEIIVATAIIVEDGVEGTGQIGTVSVAAEAPFAVTGVSASGEICGGWGLDGFGELGWGGCVVVIGDANVFEDSVSATGTVGTVSLVLDCKFPVTGVAGTGELGNVGFPVTVEITGVQAQVILSDEVVVADAVVIEDGVEGTGQLGTVTVYAEYIAVVTGVSATGGIGTVTTESAYGVTGVSATGQIGTVTVKVAYLVTGVSATGYIGSQTPAVNVWGLIDTDQNANWTQIAA